MMSIFRLYAEKENHKLVRGLQVSLRVFPCTRQDGFRNKIKIIYSYSLKGVYTQRDNCRRVPVKFLKTPGLFCFQPSVITEQNGPFVFLIVRIFRVDLYCEASTPPWQLVMLGKVSNLILLDTSTVYFIACRSAKFKWYGNDVLCG